MKKIFTLFAVALVSLCALAEDGPCPSKLMFTPAAQEQDANKVTILLDLLNSSENLNGFNMEIDKRNTDSTDPDHPEQGTFCEGLQWVMDEDDEDWVGFSGYGQNIIGMASGSHNANWYESNMFKKADLKCNVKPTNNRLVIIEILSTLDPRFYPVFEEVAATVARFTVDLSGLEDGEYQLVADATPETCSFTYTGGTEGTRAWTTDDPVVIVLKKIGDKVIKVETAIEGITTDQAVDNNYYDLMGRKLDGNNLPAGIYIHNGKKYIQK